MVLFQPFHDLEYKKPKFGVLKIAFHGKLWFEECVRPEIIDDVAKASNKHYYLAKLEKG